MQTKIFDVDIHDGKEYRVKVKMPNGFILATECVGYWPMTNVSTGSVWLDSQLSRAVQTILENEAIDCDDRRSSEKYGF